jgi:hypothetical protein
MMNTVPQDLVGAGALRFYGQSRRRLGGDRGHVGGICLVLCVCCGGVDFRSGVDYRCGVERGWVFVTERLSWNSNHQHQR